MDRLKFLLTFTIIWLLSNQAFAETITQNIWFLATNKNDSVALYQIAQAYNPLIKNDDWDCRSHQFYLEVKNKKLAGCQNKSADKYIEFLTKSAENSYPIAQKDLGIAYITGKVINKDIHKGLYWLEKAATPISGEAKFSVGEGTLWLNKEGKQTGVGQAHYFLGLLYDEGIDVKTDYTKAIKHYKIASKSYDWGFYGLAQYHLYLLYKNKINDPRKSLYWLEQTANHLENDGKINPELLLVDYFLNGGQADGSTSEQPNYLWAARWLHEVVDDDKIPKEKRQEKAFLLAWFYLNGLGVQKDPELAAHYYHLGSKIHPHVELNDDSSLQNQFLLYVIKPLREYQNDAPYKDFDPFDEEYYPKRIKSLEAKQASNEKSFDAIKASEIMNKIFSDNKKDEEKFYRKFIEKIKSDSIYYDEYHCILPLLKLSQQRELAYGFYREAELIKGKQVNQLLELYQSAVKLEPNNPTILYQYGTLYDFVMQNMEKAISHYKQAAELGNSVANYRLGVVYYLGKGVQKNYRDAWRYLNMAAQQGYKPAQEFLIEIDKSHPEFEWLSAQYVDHQQNFQSPTVIVDDEDWLETLNERAPNPKVTYHFTKHKFKGNGLKTFSGCRAALKLASEGDISAQQELLVQLSQEYLNCDPKPELMFALIDNSDNDEQKKLFLKAKYFKKTKQNKDYQKIIKSLADHQYQDAILEITEDINAFCNPENSQYITNLKKLRKLGNLNAVALLAKNYSFCDFKKKTFYNTYQYTKTVFLLNDFQYTKAELLRNDLKINLPNKSYTKYFFADNILSPADIYKIWFELAEMHETGIEVPKNNIFALVWYRLLVENNQTQAENKVEQIIAQLTAEQLFEANKIFEKYRDIFCFFPLKIMDINDERYLLN